MKNITEIPINKETFDKWKAAWNNIDPIPDNISRYCLDDYNSYIERNIISGDHMLKGKNANNI